MSCSDNKQACIKQFNENTQTTRDSFPSLNELQQIFYKEDFNNLLNIIKNRIIMAKRANTNFSRINIPELLNIPQAVISDVKNFLRNMGYIITDVEDNTGIPSGFKIAF